ncbi:MAG: polysaccharide biosynthesis tyrosine autokinase [Isosphaeraceae bacterium]
MNQASRVTGELTGPISTTATVVDTIGSDGTGMVHSAYPVVVHPQPTSSPSPMGLLRALKRRLALALGLAILVSGVSSLAAWFLLPPPKYQAQAKVLVRTETPQIMWKTIDAETDRDGSQRYEKSQLIQIKSRFVINTALGQRGISDLNMIREQARPAEWLTENLQAQFLQGTEVLQVSLDGKDPVELARLVNAVTNTYIEEVANGDLKRRVQRRELLKNLSNTKFAEMKSRRDALRTLAQRAGSDDRQTLILKQQYAIELGTDVRKDLREVQSQKRKLEAMIKVQRPEALHETAAPMVSNDDVARLIEQDQEVSDLKAKLAAASDRLESEATYTGRVARKSGLNPALKTLRDEVDLIYKQLERKRKAIRPSVIRQLQNPQGDGQSVKGGSLEQQLAVLTELEASLQEEIKNFSQMDQVLTDNTLDVQDNKEELKQIEDAATKIASEVEKLNVELQAPPRISLIEDAIPPTTRNVKKWYTMFGGISLGSFLGTLIAIAFLELQTRKIDSADEVVGDLGLAVVGSLPMLPARARRNGVMAHQEKDRYWYSLLLESIDATRTMLIHAARSGSHRVIMITSALPGEGKTSVASHLATSLARSGQKTLLIDADLRCPSIHRLFDLTPNPGLSELLRGEVAFDDVIVSTAVEELKVITAGKCDPQTLKILSQGGLGGLFARLKEQYDFVIVDSSPILAVADAQIIAQQVDAVLFSILADVSRKTKIQAAYQRISALGVKVLGAVVTGSHDSGYGTNYYSGRGRSTPSDTAKTTTETEAVS